MGQNLENCKNGKWCVGNGAVNSSYNSRRTLSKQEYRRQHICRKKISNKIRKAVETMKWGRKIFSFLFSSKLSEQYQVELQDPQNCVWGADTWAGRPHSLQYFYNLSPCTLHRNIKISTPGVAILSSSAQRTPLFPLLYSLV